ncbi:VOC family protein [Rhodopila sp.]|uniref:VOC family protein n=1 Tax=Rhodopila sp. TaxID=2480087 RepID=UPI003D0DFF8A
MKSESPRIRTGVTQLGYLGIGVSDLLGWRDFATSALGLQENGAGPRGEIYFRIDDHHQRFALFPTGEDDLLHTGWEAKDAHAMHDIASQVRAMGVEVTEATREDAAARMALGLIRFKDPDGLTVEVFHGPLLDRTPLLSPRGIGRFKAQELGLGHIVLKADDTDKTLRFYMLGLGVKLTDYIHVERGGKTVALTFTHVNPRHHSMALVPGLASGVKRLQHFMVEVESLDDVGAAMDIMQQRGIETGRLGRHTNDLMISFYVVSPSGFNIEYGWGGRTIDDESKWTVQDYRATSIWGHGPRG